MAIDLGTDVTKVAVVRAGMPMEIVLDSSSKRTIPTLVLLKEGNRLFGNSAFASAIRDPTIVFAELPSIVGKTLDHPLVSAYQKRYPYHQLVFSHESGQLAFVVNGTEFTVETLLAMFLQYVRKTAEAFAESPMKTAVITVPSYFTQSERRAILRAANLANIEVIQLMDDNVAVALDYIRPRIKILEERPIYLFFDVGATGTTATVVSYQMGQVKGESSGEHPHVFVLGAASDTILGTNAFIDRLQAHLVNRFKTLHNIDVDITKIARVVAKFRREACRVFKILSANKEIHSTVEEVFNGLDLRVKISRTELETICADLVQRVPHIINAALEAVATSPTPLNVTLSDFREVIVFGGGSRIPIIQAAILSATNMQTLGKSVNSDEAAAMGAVYQAASNTRGFLVKRFVLRESSRYPLAVTFPRISHDNESDSIVSELITRVLFPINNPFPQKRTIKFPRLQDDISFQVHYAEIPESLSRYINGASAILNVNISGVRMEIEKFKKSGHSPQAVKAHLELDASGIIQLSEVNLILTHEASENSSEGAPSTLKKPFTDFVEFADGISNLFGSGEANRPADRADEPTKGENETQMVKNSTSSATPANATIGGSQKTMIHPLSFHVEILDPVNPPLQSIGASIAILREYDAADNERDLLNEAKNELEQTIFTTLKDIETAFDNHTTQAETEALRAVTNEISQWYDDDGYHAPRSSVEEQLTKLREAIDPYRRRVQAFAELPLALDRLEEVLTSKAQPIGIVMRANSAAKTVTASEFVEALNDTLEEEDERKIGLPIYSYEEVEALRKHIYETQTWLKETREALANCDRRADPPVRLSAVTERLSAMASKLEYFGHKGEVWFTTYKRLFNIKKTLLAETSGKAAVTGNATSEDNTVVEAAHSEEQTATEAPETVTEPKTTPRPEL